MIFNRPKTHHSFNENMIDRFCELVDQTENDASIAVVVLSSRGNKSFCSGGDVSYFRTLTAESAIREMSRKMTAALDKMERGKTVYIASVNGNAYGGGCEILTACHFRLAADDVHFSFRQAANGIFTGWGGGQRLFKLLRPNNALRLFLTSEELSSTDAEKIHFVDAVYPADRLPEEARKLAETIAAPTAEFRPGVFAFAKCHSGWPRGYWSTGAGAVCGIVDGRRFPKMVAAF